MFSPFLSPLSLSLFPSFSLFRFSPDSGIVNGNIQHQAMNDIDLDECEQRIQQRSAPHTAPVTTKIHFPFDAPKSPRSVRTVEKTEQLFTFEKSGRNGGSGSSVGGGVGDDIVTMEGNSVYYNRHRSSVSYSSSTGNNKSDKTSKTKENHNRQKYNYDEPSGGEKYSKYSRKDAAWRKRYESNGTTGLNKANDYGRGSGSGSGGTSAGHGKMAKRFDDTMFPFDREAIGYDPQEATNEWYKNNARYLSNFGSNQYDTPSPDYDYYESFCAKATSAPRKSSTSDVRLFKELTRISHKQQQDEQRAKQMSAGPMMAATAMTSQAPHYPSKLSKYDNTPTSPSTSPKQLPCMTKYEQNHISDPDAFSPLPAKQINETNNSTITSITTTTTTTTTNTNNNNTSSNANSNSKPNNNNNNCCNKTTSVANTTSTTTTTAIENSVSKFEQIASMFDQIPPKPSDAFRKSSYVAAADQVHNSSNSAIGVTTPPQPTNDHQSTGYGTVSSPLPDFRVDFFAETSTNEKSTQKRHSFVENNGGGGGAMTTHRPSSASQHDTQPINVTSNPMDESNGCTSTTQQTPRATIVVQQVCTMCICVFTLHYFVSRIAECGLTLQFSCNTIRSISHHFFSPLLT